MNIRRATLLALTGMLLGILTTALGQIQPGYHREDVFRVLGTPDYRGRMGQTETLNYKNGTKIVLSNGVVQEVSVPGQIRIGNTVKVIEVARPATTAAALGRVPKPASETKAPSAKIPEPSAAQPTVAATVNEVPTTAKPITPLRSVAKAQSASAVPTVTVGRVGGIIASIKKIIAGLLLVFVGLFVVMYGFTCFCFKLICERAGKPGGALVWIPIAQFIPLLRVADMREWMLALLLIPIVNIGFAFMLWAKVCVARGKNPWLAASFIVPLGGLVMIAYLAFSAANERSEETEVAGTPAETTEVTETNDANSTECVTEESVSDAPFSEMPDPSAPEPTLQQPSPAA